MQLTGKAQSMRQFPVVSRYRFEFQAIDPIRLPSYSGSMWRGLLGHGLRRTLCVTRRKTCTGCLLEGSCLYSSFFESPALGVGATGRGDDVPHPFVLSVVPDAPRDIAPGNRLGFGITLIGPSPRILPYLIHALQNAAGQGIGRGRGRSRLVGVKAEPDLGARQWKTIYSQESARIEEIPGVSCDIGAAPERVGMHIQTPLRIKRYGKLVGPREFDAGHLAQQLLRRCDELSRLYVAGDSSMPLQDVQEHGTDIQFVNAHLLWRDWTRYSARQGRSMRMGGLVGDLILQGEGLSGLWPRLWLGQWVHLGKATSMGLGRYRLLDAASLPARACA